MKRLFAAACTLAAMFGTSTDQAQAKGDRLKSATARTATPVSGAHQRDHRGPYGRPGGGVRVRPSCGSTGGFGCREPHNH